MVKSFTDIQYLITHERLSDSMIHDINSYTCVLISFTRGDTDWHPDHRNRWGTDKVD